MPFSAEAALPVWRDDAPGLLLQDFLLLFGSFVHGKEEADKAQTSARALFSGEGDDSNMPTTTLSDTDFVDGKINVADLMVICKLTASKGEAKRIIQQGGVTLNGNKVNDFALALDKALFVDGVKIKKGKKVFHKAII